MPETEDHFARNAAAADEAAPVYLVRIRPLPDPTDPRGYRRLKWLLKVTLRSKRLGFQCLGARQERRSSRGQ